MSQRDCGWIQLFAKTNQEALDLHIMAFRLAEELGLPVMICMAGFNLTHAFERVDMPTQAQVDAFLPRFNPSTIVANSARADLRSAAMSAALTSARAAYDKPPSRKLLQ